MLCGLQLGRAEVSAAVSPPRSAEAKAGSVMPGCSSVPSLLLSVTRSGEQRREERCSEIVFLVAVFPFPPFRVMKSRA